MWEGQQWAFQELLQGYLHNPTIWQGIIAWNLSLFSLPTSIKWAHYIDDMMLTCKDLPLLQDTLQALLNKYTPELQWQRGWEVNLQRIQGPGTAIKFLGVVWSDRMYIVPETVIVKVQAYPIPKNMKEVQTFEGMLEFWKTFIFPLAECLHLLFYLVRKGSMWDWGSEQ